MRRGVGRFLLSAPLALCLVCCLASVAAAQKGNQPKRISFGKGRTTAVLKGSVSHERSDTYILTARAGQQMTVHAASRGQLVIFSLTAPGGPIEDGLEVRDWSGTLPDAGDYLIGVWNKNKRGFVPYTLEVTIR